MLHEKLDAEVEPELPDYGCLSLRYLGKLVASVVSATDGQGSFGRLKLKILHRDKSRCRLEQSGQLPTHR